ncbi:MAG: hypothetical protein H0Z38_07255 [Firmicutes bacterium]|nr:hypothetical protein [Bacillota bacterium]
MRAELFFAIIFSLVLALAPSASAGFSVEAGYGSASLTNDLDSSTGVRSKLFFLNAGAEWLFKDDAVGLAIQLSGAGQDGSFTPGIMRTKAGLVYRWENVRFFAGPTWTGYQPVDFGQRTRLEGIELGGSGKIDFTDSLHLEGGFYFSPLLEGFTVTLPDADIDTLFTGNISEYYFGLAYDLSSEWSIAAVLGGWRVWEPVSQDRLAVIDYRRLGLQYTF